MSTQLEVLVARARVAADRPESGASASSLERQQLERLGSEFESTLMVQMLKDMRRAGRWDDEEGGDTSRTQSLLEMLDVELASAMTKAQGLGLTAQMLDAFDRAQGSGTPATAASVQDAFARAIHQPVQPAPEVSVRPDVAPEVSDRSSVPPDAPRTSRRAGDVSASEITSPFGWRRDPITGEARFHRGVDLRAAYGQDVPASTDGRVVFSGSQGSYGTTVVLEHANGTRTRYAHLSVALAKAGDTIGAGQLVGRAGSSGRATGPHVHVELLDRQGMPVDPTKHGVL